MRLLIFFIAIALAVGAFFFTLQFTNKEKSAQPGTIVQSTTVQVREQPKVKVFVARRDIPIGTVVQRDMLDIVDYQQNLALPDMAVVQDAGASPVDGMVSRSPIVKGEVIMKSKFANPKDPSFMAAAMPEGMRLVTISTDAVSGDGGFIYPGDRVDVLITREVPMGGNNASGTPLRTPVSEVLIPNVRVLAVNQKSTTQAGEGPTLPSSVSLEVSALDAQRLRLAENGNGRLSLALRSLKDAETAAVARPVGTGDLSRLTNASFFPVLYDNLNSYTPKVVTSAPGAVPSEAQGGAAPAGGSVSEGANNTSIDVIRGVKKESVQIPILPFF